MIINYPDYNNQQVKLGNYVDEKTNADDISEIKKDMNKVKRNIEDKLIRNELARQRDEEIKKRKYSYFKENQKEKSVEEDKTKLFFDENMIKQSFQKKKHRT